MDWKTKQWNKIIDEEFWISEYISEIPKKQKEFSAKKTNNNVELIRPAGVRQKNSVFVHLEDLLIKAHHKNYQNIALHITLKR